MKLVWTFLMAMVLVLGQFTAAAHPSDGLPMPCACCSCAQINCCTDASTPVPAAPVSSQPEFRAQFAAVAIPTLVTPAVGVTPDSFFKAPFPPALRSIVPVYDRHCSYLI